MRRSKRLVSLSLILCATVIGWPASGPAASAGNAPPIVHPCPRAPDVLCGSIQVPLYWKRPNLGGRTLTVRFRVFPHTDRTQAGLEPLVGMEGGPGYGSIGSASTYLFLMRNLHQRHDLIVIDQRGTGGSGAIDCPAVQKGIGPYAQAVGKCARQLGIAAGAYGSAAVGDDLAAILAALHVGSVDVYGDSYGTYAAQVFTLHHPDLVRAVVLDSAYNNGFDLFEREASVVLRHAWRALCRRASGCGGDILGAIARLDRRLESHPLVGIGRDADGGLHHVRLTATGFAQLVADATYYYSALRDLPAAIRAFDRGARAPMLRLAAEDAAAIAPGGSARGYSEGDYAAVACHDYPAIWRRSSDLGARRAQLRRAIARLEPDAFLPFSTDAWLHSLYENQLVRGCVEWPRSPVSDPAFPRGIHYPDVPVLVLSGEFDQSTPAADAMRVARAFPNSTFVEVANTVHITAEADSQRCASVIVRRFLATLHAGDTSCAAAMPPVAVMPAFPVRVAEAPQARPADSADRSTTPDRRAAWVAAEMVGDALTRWYNLMYGPKGHGLYGGSYAVSGAYLGNGPLSIRFRGSRLVKDLAVWGTAVWDRHSLSVDATLRIAGPGQLHGTVRIVWSTHDDTDAQVTGQIHGRLLHLTAPSPWRPQG